MRQRRTGPAERHARVQEREVVKAEGEEEGAEARNVEAGTKEG